jgi:DNA-binding CsgD family transcriptional regulator
MPITLHADLLDTDLQDFDAHWRGTSSMPYAFLPGMYGVTFSIERSEEDPTFHIESRLYRGVGFPIPMAGVFVEDDYEDAAKSLENSWADPNFASFLERFVMTKRTVFPAGIHYVTAVLASKLPSMVPYREFKPSREGTNYYKPVESYFALLVARYRRSRLKLVVEESDIQGHSGRAIWAWIRPQWGDAAELLSIQDAPTPTPEMLTERQKQVADLIADGLTDKEMAQHFVLSPHTMKTHRKQIRERLGIAGN